MTPNPNLPAAANPQHQNQPPVPEAGRFQMEKAVPAREVAGFRDCRVFLTTEMKLTSAYLQRRNEDDILTDAATGLVGVMDGLGGQANGDQASRAVEQILPEVFTKTLAKASKETAESLTTKITKAMKQKLIGIGDDNENKMLLEKMRVRLAAADQQISAKAWALIMALRKANPSVEATGGMTTASVGLIHRTPAGEHYAIVANIGDSGAFIRNRDGKMRRLTSEDSGLDSMIRQRVNINGQNIKSYLDDKRDPATGDIPDSLIIPIPITAESCRALAYTQDQCDNMLNNGKQNFELGYGTIKAMVTNVLGQTVPPIPSIEIVRLEAGDELILATDGLIDKYENARTGETDIAELEQDAALASNPAEMLDILRVMAKQRHVSYKPDDDIAIVVAKAE